MKRVYIPKGEAVIHESLHTDRLIVKGSIKVNGTLYAKQIYGNGSIEAGHIICDDLRADTVIAEKVSAQRIAVKRLFVLNVCRASDAIAVSDILEADVVETRKLTLCLSKVGSIVADEVIHLKRKKQGLISLLWRSWWRCAFLPGKKGKEGKVGPKKKLDTKSPQLEVVQISKTPDVPISSVATELAPKMDVAIQSLVILLEAMRDSCGAVSEKKADDEGAA